MVTHRVSSPAALAHLRRKTRGRLPPPPATDTSDGPTRVVSGDQVLFVYSSLLSGR